MGQPPAYQYDEFRQVGTDYADPAEAAQYDNAHADFRDIDRECHETLARLELRPGDTLVDFGCGTGRLAVHAAQLGLRVIAVDISPAMLAQARAHAARAGAPGIRFVHAGFLTYTHDGPPAAAVTASLALHHLPDLWKGVALLHIRDLLETGGQFSLQDVVLPAAGVTARIDAFVQRQHHRGGDYLKHDAETHFREEYSTYDWIMDGLLQRASFTIEDRTWADGVFAHYLCRAE